MATYFNLYPNCIITEGKLNSLITDYKNETYFQIPTFLVSIINELTQIEFTELLNKHKDDIELSKKINSFRDWLVINNIGMMAPKSKIFATLQNNFEFATISNAVMEIDTIKNSQMEQLEAVLMQLSQLKCQTLQLILLNKIDLPEIFQFLKFFDSYIFSSVELVISFNVEPSIEEVELLLYQNLFLKKIFMFGCKQQKVVPISKLDAVIVFSTQMDYSPGRCGWICKEYFSTNLMTYLEGQKHNTCLNQKIAVDSEGNIKNCLSFKENFGNISEKCIQEIVNNEIFQKYWNITKDSVQTCKHCEFRNVCTDCRAYLEDPSDIYSKPLKCGYEPTTGVWSAWKANPFKQKLIQFYSL